MTSALFSESPLLVMPLIGLFIFVMVFTVITVRTLKTRKATIDTLARLPLDGDDV